MLLVTVIIEVVLEVVATFAHYILLSMCVSSLVVVVFQQEGGVLPCVRAAAA